MKHNESSPHPRIVVVAVGNGATQGLSSLVPNMPNVEFISYVGTDEPTEHPVYDHVINHCLEYRVYPACSSYISREYPIGLWKEKPVSDGDEIWRWSKSTVCGGTIGYALVRDGNIIDSVQTGFIN